MLIGLAKRDVTAPGQEPSPAVEPAAEFPAPPAGDDVVLSNQGFVTKIACEYRNLGLPLEDLLNEGNVGLLEAAQRFDPNRGTRFITYAIYWIRKSILKAVSRHQTLVRIPDYRIRQARAIKDMGRSLSSTLGREAGSDEISQAMALTIGKMEQILQAQLKELPLDAPVGESKDSTMLDRMVDERAVSPEAGLIQDEHTRLLKQALRQLTAQQRLIIVRRYGLAGGPSRTLGEIGARLGLSRERVRQIEKAATTRLRKAIAKGPARGPQARSANHPSGSIGA